MRWGEQITLIALSDPSPSTNEHGFPVARIETATTVFADKKSVGFSEFYKAQQAGYTTELKFDVHSFEYEEQQIVEYPCLLYTSIEDGNKNKLFVPNSMVDPITAGRIYGASVKVDNEIADNVIYLGTKGQVIANDYDELEIFSAIEPKTANEVKTAYSLFDACLLYTSGDRRGNARGKTKAVQRNEIRL